MKNKKKLIALTLALVLLIAVAVSATLAYFTHTTEAAENTMAVGNVAIEQLELDRDNVAFANKTINEVGANVRGLYPAVYDPNVEGLPSYDKEITLKNGSTFSIWDKSVSGEIDKFIYVQNTGSLDAYVRTIILFEHPSQDACDMIHFRADKSDGQELVWVRDENNAEVTVSIGGVNYCIAVATYNTALEPNQISAPSLCQIFLDPTADNSWSTAVNGEYSIIAFSQATQTAGFDDNGYTAGKALDASFGAVTAETVAEWVDALGLNG